jgi:hypothetical protein
MLVISTGFRRIQEYAEALRRTGLVRGNLRGEGVLCPPPSRREPSMWILLERLSVVRESLDVCSIREFIFSDGIREGDGMVPEDRQ